MLGEQRLPDYEMAAPQAAERAEAPAPRDAWLDKPLLALVNWEVALYALFIVLAIVSRFYDLGARAMSHDESLHTYFSYQLANGRGFQHTPLMHGPFIFHITALSYFLFGANDFTSRVPIAIFGVVLVILPVFFRHWLGRTGALATSFMLLISPSILYHARYIRQEESILVWTTLTVLCVWRYFESRQTGWLFGLAVVLAFHATDKSTSFLSVALFFLFLAPVALWQLSRMRKRRRDALTLVGFGAVTAVFMVGLCIAFELIGSRIGPAVGLSSLSLMGGSISPNALVYFAIMIALAAAVCLALIAFYRRVFGAWMRAAAQGSAAFNLLIVFVTTTMFMGSPAMLLIKNRIWEVFRGEELVPIALLGDMANLQNNPNVIATMFAMAVALIAIAVAMGVVWGGRRWGALIALFLGITVTLFTTVYTNTAGFGSGFVGQLGYWMAQQDVKRGSQPWYYYGLLVPMYEYTLLIGSLCAMTLLSARLLPQLRNGKRFLVTLKANLFIVFVVWWTLATCLIYTIAGEKMPWLTVHFALPMAFLTGWFIHWLVTQALPAMRHSPPARVLGTAGLALLAVVLFIRLLSLIGGLNLGGADRAAALQWVLNFALAAAALTLTAYFLGRVAHSAALPAMGLAAFAVLSVLTVRTAVTVTYINYDYVKEFLFYAHGAPGVKIALNQIEDLQKRAGGKEPIKVGYTQETSWPLSWYMTQYPGARFFGSNLPGDFEDFPVVIVSEQDANFAQMLEQLSPNYRRFDYMLVWWPMQDYFDLNWERVSYSLFNPEARAALWEIAFNRNYEPYARLFNKTSLTAENWSPGHRFSLFVRNDMAEQLWDYRAGAVATGQNPSQVTGPTLQSPAGIAFAPDGTRYLVDHKSNRIFHQDADGNAIQTWGGGGNEPGKFNDPWGIAVDAGGNVYVADTFNHRIQKFDANGQFVMAWGRPGASLAPGTGTDTEFFGPRDIAIDGQGRLLVSDTGNKRVQAFDANGNFIGQFGSAGSGDSQFNEPVGLAVDSAGNIYVADTWNQRIQVFDSAFNFVRAFPVAEWAQMPAGDLQNVDHKPYLAIEGNTLFVSSPRTAQVLGFTLQGTPVALPDITFATNALPTGVRVNGNALFVTDAANAEVKSFVLNAGGMQ
jgi:uncharacterized protein (TIGR03663 family)